MAIGSDLVRRRGDEDRGIRDLAQLPGREKGLDRPAVAGGRQVSVLMGCATSVMRSMSSMPTGAPEGPDSEDLVVS
jgi:hypothetical protein